MMRAIEDGHMPGDAAAAKSRITARIPLGRDGAPDEVTQLALFLASDDSRFSTGGYHSIDGHVTAG